MRLLRAALCGAAILAGCGLPPPPAATVYRDLEAGFALEIPPGWQVTHGYGDTRLLLTPDAGRSAERVSLNWDRPLDGAPRGLDEYAVFRARRFAHFGRQRTLIAERRQALNAALPEAARYDYQYQATPGHAVRSRSWLAVSGRGGYTLTLTAPPDRFALRAADFERIERSFRLLP